jgi:transposase-like protein
MPPPFENDTTARKALEALRWPDGPQCPHCAAGGPEVFQIGGEKHSHRDGLYQCKPCRRSFSVTVGTPLERLRVPLSTWMRAAREFSADDTRRAYNARRKDNLVPLSEMAPEIGVSYRTVLRMRDIIKRAAGKYRGHKKGFGAWPRSFMRHKGGGHEAHARSRLLAAGKHPSQHTIKSSEVLAGFVSARVSLRPALARTEQLLRLLLLATPKWTPRKRRSFSQGAPTRPLSP